MPPGSNPPIPPLKEKSLPPGKPFLADLSCTLSRRNPAAGPLMMGRPLLRLLAHRLARFPQFLVLRLQFLMRPLLVAFLRSLPRGIAVDLGDSRHRSAQ